MKLKIYDMNELNICFLNFCLHIEKNGAIKTV